MVKAVHQLDWFSFENGARADLETMLEGADAFDSAVFTYKDENGNLRNDLMHNAAQVTRPSREGEGSYQESNYLDASIDVQGSTMDFETLAKAGWEGASRSNSKVQEMTG